MASSRKELPIFSKQIPCRKEFPKVSKQFPMEFSLPRHKTAVPPVALSTNNSEFSSSGAFPLRPTSLNNNTLSMQAFSPSLFPLQVLHSSIPNHPRTIATSSASSSPSWYIPLPAPLSLSSSSQRRNPSLPHFKTQDHIIEVEQADEVSTLYFNEQNSNILRKVPFLNENQSSPQQQITRQFFSDFESSQDSQSSASSTSQLLKKYIVSQKTARQKYFRKENVYVRSHESIHLLNEQQQQEDKTKSINLEEESKEGTIIPGQFFFKGQVSSSFGGIPDDPPGLLKHFSDATVSQKKKNRISAETPPLKYASPAFFSSQLKHPYIHSFSDYFNGDSATKVQLLRLPKIPVSENVESKDKKEIQKLPEVFSLEQQNLLNIQEPQTTNDLLKRDIATPNFNVNEEDKEITEDDSNKIKCQQQKQPFLLTEHPESIQCQQYLDSDPPVLRSIRSYLNDKKKQYLQNPSISRSRSNITSKILASADNFTIKKTERKHRILTDSIDHSIVENAILGKQPQMLLKLIQPQLEAQQQRQEQLITPNQPQLRAIKTRNISKIHSSSPSPQLKKSDNSQKLSQVDKKDILQFTFKSLKNHSCGEHEQLIGVTNHMQNNSNSNSNRCTYDQSQKQLEPTRGQSMQYGQQNSEQSLICEKKPNSKQDMNSWINKEVDSKQQIRLIYNYQQGNLTNDNNNNTQELLNLIPK